MNNISPSQEVSLSHSDNMRTPPSVTNKSGKKARTGKGSEISCTIEVSAAVRSNVTNVFDARASDTNEPSANDESDDDMLVSQASVANGTSLQDATNEESFQDFDDMTNHTNVANGMLHKVSCEENCLRKQRCKRTLLSMCIGMMKGSEVFKHENDEVCSKCPLAEMRKLFLPKNKDLHDEVARRNYCATRIIKNARVGM